MTTSPLPLTVAENSQVEIEFELTLLDGTQVEKTDAPFTFTLGDGTFLPNLEEMLIGLEEGTTAKFTLSPERAFGGSDPANIHPMPRTDFSEKMNLQPGVVIGFKTPTGEEIPGTIVEVSDDVVLVDFNHPLANHSIVFTATILAIHS